MSSTSQRDHVHASPVSTPDSVSGTREHRRRFLLALGAGTAGSAVAVTKALAAPVAGDAATVAATDASGYRETEHVRDYYATARI